MGNNAGNLLKDFLSQNPGVLMDAEDIKTFAFRKVYWCNGYVCTTVNGRPEYLHRLIMKATKEQEVDHKNNNVSDNRKSALRICTHSQNMRNSSVRADNTSGYKGVSWDKSRDKFEAYIHLVGAFSKKSYKKHLGRFDTAEQAAEAYNVAALRYHGEFAKLNVLTGSRAGKAMEEGDNAKLLDLWS